MQLHQWFTMMLFRTISERLTKLEELIDQELQAANAGILEQLKRESPDVDPSDWIDAKILQSQTRLAFFLTLLAHFEPLLLEHAKLRKNGKRYVDDIWEELDSHPRRTELDLDRLRAIFEVRNRLLHDGFVWSPDLAAVIGSVTGLSPAGYDGESIDVADDFVKRIAEYLADTYRTLETVDSAESASPITPLPLTVSPRTARPS